MQAPPLPRYLIPRLPFFYGWVVLGCICLAGFARQGPAVAVLSIFVVPMTDAFGWSRTEMSGAVSLGGVLAAIISPMVGPFVDRRGARLVLCLAVAGIGIACMALSFTQSLLVFYVLFCFARMTWAGPFDLGLYGALNNWFVARRAIATSIATLAQMSGLVVLPLVAQFAMTGADWRAGWIAVGATVLIVGFVPCWLLLVRRPEDVGLQPDRLADGTVTTLVEPRWSRAEAMRTPAFWLLSLYTVLVFPVQAGVSLHQAPHLIERGIPPVQAAAVIAFFSAMSAVASLGIGFMPRRWPVRNLMAVSAACLGVGSFGLIGVSSAVSACLPAGLFGLGIGGVMMLLPMAWADYFGRESYGAIRGVALTMQVTAQAAGPLVSGLLRDSSGNYSMSLMLFGVLAALAVFAALAARQPRLRAV
ncbi:MAG: MFS transporter [Alphaproteobacteria bacterium]|nr:MFS transporter [Alphaproteobacteria bacterium]